MITLLQRIEEFLAVSGMSERRFGEKAARDTHLVRQLRAGREPRMKTVAKIDAFIAGWKQSLDSDTGRPDVQHVGAPADPEADAGMMNAA